MQRLIRSYMGHFLMVLVLTIAFRELNGVRIIEIKVPPRVKSGDSVNLGCLFDLEGQSLYSLNWWLNNEQFYQFDPSEGKQQIIYETPGVHVDAAESNLRVVTLQNVSKATSGEFKCEIVADFPSYERDSLTAPMEVIDVPSTPPVISLGRQQYEVGMHLRANCTAQGSKPHPVILWYLNGKKINSKHVKQIYPLLQQKSNHVSDQHNDYQSDHKNNFYSDHWKDHQSDLYNDRKNDHRSNHKNNLYSNHMKEHQSDHQSDDRYSDRKKDHRRGHHHKRDLRRQRKRRIKRNIALSPVISHVSLLLRKSYFTKDERAVLTCTAIYSGVFHRATKVDLTAPEGPSMIPSLRVSSASRHQLQYSLPILGLSFALTCVKYLKQRYD